MNPIGRAPADFDEVFRHYRDLPIVGGQAVNLWAEYYVPRAAELAPFVPFLSKDADLYGRQIAEDSTGAPPGWKLQTFHEPRQTAVALLTKQLADGSELRVEVMRAVHGLAAEDFASTALFTPDTQQPGKVYRLPSPVVLLKAKVANAHDLTQRERPQDLRHVRMLIPVCALYVRDLYAAVCSGSPPERTLVNTMHALLAVIRSEKSRALSATHQVDFASALPRDLPTESLPKLAAFYANLLRPPRRGRR